MNLKEWINSVEWYDNHSIVEFQDCARKYYYNREYVNPFTKQGKGLSFGVSDQANIGTCHHAALAAYYKLWGQPEKKRRLEGMKAFSREYQRLFSGNREDIRNQYSETRGHEVFDAYCDEWAFEDSLFRPIENELTLILPVRVEPGDPFHFEPFFIIQRLDGLWERINDGSWMVLETKTTARDVKGWLNRLSMDRQGTSYVWGARQFKGGEKVLGILPNIIMTAAEKYEFARDYVPKNETQIQNWRFQTILIIERLREIRKEFKKTGDNNYWEQTFSRCLDFGKCPFFDICYFGEAFAAQMEANTWTPLNIIE